MGCGPNGMLVPVPPPPPGSDLRMLAHPITPAAGGQTQPLPHLQSGSKALQHSPPVPVPPWRGPPPPPAPTWAGTSLRSTEPTPSSGCPVPQVPQLGFLKAH